MKQQIASRLSTKFWIFEIAVLVVTAYFLARGTGTYILNSLFSDSSAMRHSAVDAKISPPAPGRAPLSAARYKKRMGDPLLMRNIFDSATGPIDRTASASSDAAEPATEIGPPSLTPCGTQDILVKSTVVSESAPAWSFVSLLEDGNRKLLHIGDKIRDKAVAWISWRYLFLQNETDVCYIDIFGKDNLALSKHGKSSRPRAKTMKRRVVNKLLKNPAHFAKHARMRPKKRNGKLIGYELRRVPRNGAFSRVGLKKQDVIQKINGIALTSMDRITDAYERIQKSDSLRFSLLRKGAPLEVRIKLI